MSLGLGLAACAAEVTVTHVMCSLVCSVPDPVVVADCACSLLLLQAHQWFGDLVTLGDWTELWLNEGFATYLEVVAADAYRPTWGYFDGFLETFTSPGTPAERFCCLSCTVNCMALATCFCVENNSS
jgi:hypothetical protein